jgi:gluconate 5-dehydrogenase
MVTGGSRGIGLAAARALGECGARVILVARHEQALTASVTQLRDAGVEAEFAPFDLLQTDRISAWLDGCAHQFGQPDILVNAAGMTRRGEATELTLDDWHQVLELNATVVFELSRCFARGLFAAGSRGKIVNIASLMTAAARHGTSAYAASKGAVGQLTKALAIDWASRGILVNAIAPGYIETELNDALVADPEFSAWVRQRCPLGRWGQPEDIAWPIVFLASPASDFITGQVIYVDGGWLSTF